MWTDMDLSFALNSSGDLATNTDADAIKNSLRNILLTIPGTRRRNPSFAFGIQKYIDEFLDDTDYSAIRTYILSYIQKYEDRAVITEVSVTKTDDEKGFYIKIVYYPINQIDNLTSLGFILKSS